MSASDQQPRVVSVNVGRARAVEAYGQTFITAIWKSPVAGRRHVEGINVEGDDQADRRVHGGPTKSLYVYADEDYRWWSEQLGRTIGPGTFGENLTVAGIAVTSAVVGERWRIGAVIVRVTEPRIPCFKLGVRIGDRRFPARFATAARPGTYLAIEGPGDVGAGDVIEIVDRPDHGLTVGDIERAYHDDHTLAGRLLDVADVSEGWRSWARKVIAAHESRV